MSTKNLFSNLNDIAENINNKDNDNDNDNNDENDLTEINDCYCVNCGKNGTTRLLLTDIPYFHQVIVMSFECLYCHYHNNELQPASKICDMGIRYELQIENIKDLNRQLIKSEWSRIIIPELEFEINKQTGMITTIEGIIERTIQGLEYSLQQSNNDKLKLFIEKMKNLKELKDKTFTFIIEDISGNSFIENYLAPQMDPKLKIIKFKRTADEDRLLGIYENLNNEKYDKNNEQENNEQQNENLKDEILKFETNCSNCNSPCFTQMKLTKIPHFKEIIIMSTNCNICGQRTNEIKSGAGIEPYGKRITKKIQNENDLKLDVIRSDTCNIEIPELSLQLQSYGNGRYTTIQGLGENIIDDLYRQNPLFIHDGDSQKQEIRSKLTKLKESLQNMIGLTIILDDPCGNSFIEAATNIEQYERNWEQNEELGLNDINTNNYQNDNNEDGNDNDNGNEDENKNSNEDGNENGKNENGNENGKNEDGNENGKDNGN